MSQIREIQTKVKKKRYSSVPDMVRHVSEDSDFAESVAREIAERNIIDFLMALRTSAGMSQSDIAEKMKCSQSRISKLENGKDDDLRIGDFHAYAEAIGFELAIFLGKKERPPIALRIEYHISSLKSLFRELSKLAGDDKVIQKGAFKVIIETICTATKGLAELIKDVGRRLPQTQKKRSTRIQIEMEEDEGDCALASSQEKATEGHAMTIRG